MMPSYDYERDAEMATRGDADAKESRILADVKVWKCSRCHQVCEVDILDPMLGAFSRCHGVAAYSCDDIEQPVSNGPNCATGEYLKAAREWEGE